MAGYLLDTNVISETRRVKANPEVTAFITPALAGELFVSALTVGELWKGVALKRRADKPAGDQLAGWVQGIEGLSSTAGIAHRLGDLREARALLEPVQAALGGEIVSSGLIETPGRRGSRNGSNGQHRRAPASFNPGGWLGCKTHAIILALLQLLNSGIFMNDDSFEWDSRKAARNLANHAISFEVAREVFDDPCHIEEPDGREDYGEDRYNVIGIVKGRLLVVTYTLRGTRIRIISARMAEPKERRQYHEETN